MNFGIIAIAALLPLVIGFAWYHKMTFGKAWMRVSGVTDEPLPGGKMAAVFILTYVLSFFVGLAIQGIVIHQMHLYSVLIDEPGFLDPVTHKPSTTTELGLLYTNFMAKYGSNFRTFKHGALHGTMIAFFMIMPVIAINAMFERKGFKYIAINAGFWIVSLALMGGLVCAFP
jgi:hypothetical protein